MGRLVLYYIIIGVLLAGGAFMIFRATPDYGLWPVEYLIPAIFLEGALGLFLLASCMHMGRGTSMLGKNLTSGQVPLWSYILWWPFHTSVRVWLAVYPLVTTKRTNITEIHPGWFVGGWRVWQEEAFKNQQWAAVLDMTCEFPRRLHNVGHYMALPTWDGLSPSPPEISRAVNFLVEHANGPNPLLVHCAYGRGRSVTVLVAALVQAGFHENWHEACAYVKKLRPEVNLFPDCAQALENWEHEFKKSREQKKLPQQEQDNENVQNDKTTRPKRKSRRKADIDE